MSVQQVWMLRHKQGSSVLVAGQMQRIRAQSGESYQIFKRKDNAEQLADDVLVKKVGDDLWLSYADGTQVVLEGYYVQPGCTVVLPADNAEGKVLAQEVAGTALSDGSVLLYSHGQIPVEQLPQNTAAGIVAAPALFSGGTAVATVAGGAGLAAMGNGGGGSDNTANNTPINTQIHVKALAGPLLPEHGLSVRLYQADGITLLADGILDADGVAHFSVGNYSGVVIVKIQDASAAADFRDEATGQMLDMTAGLMAVAVANQEEVVINVNPLTTLAALLAGVVYDGVGQTVVPVDSAQNSNAMLANELGLSDITGSQIVLTINPQGQSNPAFTPDNLTAAEKYGAVLAALSGVVALNAGDMQASLDKLLAVLQQDTSNYVIRNELMQGAYQAMPNVAGADANSLVAVIAELTAQQSDNVSIDRVATDGIISLGEMAVPITGNCVPNAVVQLMIAGHVRSTVVEGGRWSYVLTQEDFNAMGQGAETIVATATLNNVSSQAMRSVMIDTANHADTVAPSLTISSDAPILSAGEAAAISFVFSEAPVGFQPQDVQVTGGTLSQFQVSSDAKVFHALLTPTAGVAAGNANVSVTAGSYSDAAGNAGTGAAIQLAVDTVAPTLQISSDVSALKTGDVAQLIFSFSEVPQDFSVQDIQTTGGSVSQLRVSAADANVYYATFTPNSNVQTSNANVMVSSGAYRDAAGNLGEGAISASFSIDTAAPRLQIISDTMLLKAGGTALLSFNFSEAPQDFTQQDVLVSGGSLSDWQAQSATRFTARYTPDPSLKQGMANVSVAAASYSDAMGNPGIAASLTDLIIDQQGPTLQSQQPVEQATAVATNSGLVLQFDETVRPGQGAVQLNDGINTWQIDVHDQSQVLFNGNRVMIMPNDGWIPGRAYSVQMAAGVMQDVAGNAFVGLRDGVHFTTSHNPAVLQINLSVIAQGRDGFVINGEQTDDWSGRSIAAVGDVNGDGRPDIIVGANGSDPAGRAYLVYGKADNLSVNLAVLGTAGFVINGDAAGDNAGFSVADAGDVNGDGLNDVLIGAPGHEHSYVVFGKADQAPVNLATLGEAGFVINGQQAGDHSGASVASGDINGDGLTDLIVGADAAGRSYVVFGKANSQAVNLSDVANGQGGFMLKGEQTGDWSGASVAAISDFNGDGLSDIVVGAWGSDAAKNNAGRSYLIWGKTDGNALDLAQVAAGQGGLVINGQAAGDWSGFSVAAAGDVNGDGLSDVMVGANNSDLPGAKAAGRSYVVFGKTDNTAINLADIGKGQGGFVINGETAHDWSGFSVAQAGDINGDGLSDVIVGAWGADPHGVSSAGRSYIVWGKADGAAVDLSQIALGVGGLAINGQNANGRSGFSVSGLADFNGDGLSDWVVAAHQVQSGAGRSYVMFGSRDSGSYIRAAVDQFGSHANDTLTGTSASETLVADAGDDVLIGNGGADVLYAGAGNDQIIINADNLNALSLAYHVTEQGQLARINGGAGIDSVVLSGSAMVLDLTSQPSRTRIESIEKFDLTGAGNNSIKLNVADVQALTGMNWLNSKTQNGLAWQNGSYSFANQESRHQLIIAGNLDDSYLLQGNWNNVGNAQYQGQSYHVLNSETGLAQVLVASSMKDLSQQAAPADQTAPTLNITGNINSLKLGDVAHVTFAFDEDVGTSFSDSDINITGGTLTALAGSGLTRTAIVTPTANSNSNVSLSVAAGSYVDATGNVGVASNALILNVDTLAPTLQISSDKAVLKAGETANVTFTFSEDPGSSFSSADISVVGGALGVISGTGVSRMAAFIPNVNSNTVAEVSVAGGRYVDAAGNIGAASNALNMNVDTVAPTVQITSDKSSLKAGETANVLFTFSEDPGSNFTAADISVVGGALGAISGTGTTRTATFTPSANSAAPASISVVGGGYVDAVGNASTPSNMLTMSVVDSGSVDGAGNTQNGSVDTIAPTVQISSDKTVLKAGETANITFAFSEDPGSSFTAVDISVTGGSLGAISGTGTTRTAVFTPSVNSNTAAAISVAGGSYVDAAGNTGAASNALSMSVDTVSPTLQISSDKTALKAGEIANITFAFSEDPGSSFTAADISVAGGSLGAISGTGTTRTAVFTPSVNSNTAAAISVAGGNYVDTVGNTGAASNVLSMSVDTVSPTLQISSDKTVLQAGETANVVFTFSEDPSNSFTMSDIVVAGGVLGALSGTGLTRTAVFVPNANSTTTAAISVVGGSYGDEAGNLGSASNTLNISVANVVGGETQNGNVDNVAPTLQIISDKTALKIGETANVTFAFSEDPGNSFTLSDIVAVGGTLGALSGTGTIRTAVFTPSVNSNMAAAISVAGGSYVDASGNAGVASNTLNMNVDTVSPTLQISSDKAALKTGETANITFAFSEDPGSSFTAVDISVTGGSLGAISGTGTTRTAVFTPSVNSNTAAAISVAGGSYVDAAGNTGAASNALSMSVDTVSPTLQISSDKTALKAGEIANITFAFSENPGSSFAAADISVAGGSLGAISGTGTTRTAVFTPSVNSNTAAAISVAGGSYVDPAGNTGAASNALSMSVDTVSPTLQISSDKAALKTGETANITFTFSENPGSSFTAADISVTGGSLGAISGTGTTRTAVFTPSVNSNTAATISVAGGSYVDPDGNTGAASNALSMSVDTVSPMLQISSDKTALKAGEIANLTFTFSENPGSSFTAADISVTGGSLGAISGTGTTRTAVFTPSVNSNTAASISVAGGSYVDAAGNTGAASNALSMSVDTVSPTLQISSDKTALKAGEIANITFTFSENPGSSFTAADISVAGGSLGAISGTGTTRTAVFTPSVNSNTAAAISVAGGSYVDAAGNAGAASNALTMNIDTVAPVLQSVSSDKSVLGVGETAALTFGFSEDPGNSFTVQDIVATLGQINGVTGSGLQRIATFTAGVGAMGTAQIIVNSGSYSDVAGNAGTTGYNYGISVDAIAPTVTISCNQSVLIAGELATITFTFSEDVGNSFTKSDIVFDGGSLGDFGGTGLVRYVAFMPSSSSASASVGVNAGLYMDLIGNVNSSSAVFNVGIETIPTLQISSDKSVLKVGDTANVLFTFSDDPGNSFTLADIAVAGGALGGLSGTGVTRTAVFTPSVNSNAAAAISVAGGSYVNGTGIVGSASNTLSMSVDTVAPTVQISSDKNALKAGETANITFSFSEDPGSSFVATDISVAGGTLGAISGAGTTRTAVFTPSVNSNTAAAIGIAGGSYVDTAGNVGVASNTLNMSVDTLVPTLQINSDINLLNGENRANLTFIFDKDPGNSFELNDISISGGVIFDLMGAGISRTAKVVANGNSMNPVIINVSQGKYTDEIGNLGVASNTLTLNVDSVRPNIEITSDKKVLKAGETANITFVMSEDLAGSFVASDVSVAGGNLGALSGTGLTRTAVFTPNVNSITAAHVSVNGSNYQDVAGNVGQDSYIDISVDTQRPTVQISSANSSLIKGEATSVKFTFSEDPGSVFTSGDITVSGGTLGGIDGAGLTRIATFTPNLSGSIAQIGVKTGSYVDSAGNENLSVSKTIPINTTPVVFDLVEGVSSLHSQRIFDSGKSYSIFIRVGSDSAMLYNDGYSTKNSKATWGIWNGGNSLSTDDRIVLVGDNGPVLGGLLNDQVTKVNSNGWVAGNGYAASFDANQHLVRMLGESTNAITLFNASNQHYDYLNGVKLEYKTIMPAGLLTSQGLA